MDQKHFCKAWNIWLISSPITRTTFWWPWILFQVSENEPWKIWLSLHLVKDKIAKENTRFRKSISVEERLVLTLRYLATGMSQQSLSFAFRIGKSTVGKILAETYQELYDSLKDTYLRAPTTPHDWLRISE